ncbi:hypothetical protein DFH07DRAFT_728698 [Mycena maculata]|uniref:Uncharacterized protein n=1 Tax=Mycena maculata TaxID=230809 RepID=A0AAD7KCE9_9AGAR|nr:hypothetical protein DFH07DRAFT_728698 [Mycena maculata]
MSSTLTGARMSYAAALIASVGYGVYVVLAYQCIRRLVRRTQTWTLGRVALLTYTSLLFALQTIYFVAGCKWSEIEFVESSVDPAVFASQQSSMLAVLKDTVYTVNIWVADIFLLYRAYIIWGGHYICLAPFITYLGALATGIGLLVEISKPGAAFGQVAVIDFGTPFWSLSVTTNVLSTILIAGRLTYRRRAMYRIQQNQENYRVHSNTTASAIFAESAAMYAIVALIYIPLFARNLTLQYPFSALMGAVVSIAPTLIILRMAGGKAVTREWSNIPLTAVNAIPSSQRESHVASTDKTVC